MSNITKSIRFHTRALQKNFRIFPLAIGTALLAAGGLLMPASAAPMEIETAADTFISIANQDDNYGSNTNMNVGTGSEKSRISFIRFNLSDYTGGTGTITEATLTLIPQDLPGGTGGNTTFDLYGIQDLGANENFVENSFDWTASSYNYSNTTGLDLLGSFNLTEANEGVEYDFTSSALNTFMGNDTNNIVTFAIYYKDSSDSGFFNKFDTKENASGGSTLTVVPEPSSLVMMALGLFAVLGLARKRRG